MNFEKTCKEVLKAESVESTPDGLSQYYVTNPLLDNDNKPECAVRPKDAAELKQERQDFKDDPDVQALKAMNQTAFMALSAADRDIMVFKFLKAV